LPESAARAFSTPPHAACGECEDGNEAERTPSTEAAGDETNQAGNPKAEAAGDETDQAERDEGEEMRAAKKTKK
jgi:hypothetical protein